VKLALTNKKVLAALAVAVIVLAILGRAYYQSTQPPLTGEELARMIGDDYEHDQQVPGYPRGTAIVSCVTLTGSTYECDVQFTDAICLEGSTPAEEQIIAKVRGRDYTEVSRQEIDPGDCTVF
jgi:hypothetical protein